MSIRRVLVTALRPLAAKIVGDARGLAGEEFETEVYQQWGFSSNPSTGQAGRSPLLEVQDDPNNHLALPPSGRRVTPEGVAEMYAAAASVAVSDTGVVTITGRVIINGIEFGTHIHPTPNGPSGGPQKP